MYESCGIHISQPGWGTSAWIGVLVVTAVPCVILGPHLAAKSQQLIWRWSTSAVARCLCDPECSGTIRTLWAPADSAGTIKWVCWYERATAHQSKVSKAQSRDLWQILKKLNMVWYLPSCDSNCALILYVTKYSSKAMSDEKSVTHQPTCDAHMRDSPWFHG